MDCEMRGGGARYREKEEVFAWIASEKRRVTNPKEGKTNTWAVRHSENVRGPWGRPG